MVTIENILPQMYGRKNDGKIRFFDMQKGVAKSAGNQLLRQTII